MCGGGTRFDPPLVFTVAGPVAVALPRRPLDAGFVSVCAVSRPSFPEVRVTARASATVSVVIARKIGPGRAAVDVSVFRGDFRGVRGLRWSFPMASWGR